MKSAAAIVLAGAALVAASADAQAAGNDLHRCRARVVYSEELPFAPIGSWLVNATLQVMPPHGAPYYAILREWMPWQGSPPRRGQALRLWCDPANPNNLHLVSRTTSSF